MKRLLLTVLAAVSLCACTKELESRVDALEKRVDELESKVNENASSISKLVEAAAKAVTITSVETLEDGYKIYFSDGTVSTLTNGVDGVNGDNGKDAVAPVVGIKEVDGVYYWTIDGEFILQDGEKVPVTGKDGKDGVDGNDGVDGKTPQFKIENSVWYVSFDGENWTEVPVSGTVEPKLVMEETDDAYIFTLGETVITIAKENVFSLKVTSDTESFETGTSVIVLKYTLTGNDGTVHVTAESDDLKVVVDEYNASVYVYLDSSVINGHVLIKAVRNSDAKYSAQYVTVVNSAYGTHGGKITISDTDYTAW